MDMSRFREALRMGCAPGALHWACRLNDLGKGDSPSPPDYTPLANASKESAEVMAKLGREQLDESKRQYEKNIEVAKPVVDAQLGIMRQTAEQGADYYGYNKGTFRPVEEGLVKDATEFSTAGAKEGFARKAVADLEGAQANEQAQIERASAAMGVNPNSGRFAGMRRATQISNAGARAGAMTGARERADNLGFARKMDVTGLGRGLPGASTGAYSVATGAGNSAVNNQMAPGGQLLAGMGAGAGMTQAGLGMQQSGLSNIAGMQTNNYNAALANDSSGLGGVLGMAKMGLDIYTGGKTAGLWGGSDRRLKENIEPVGKDARTGLNLYEFNYIGDDTRLRGVMADEVEPIMPQAVAYDDMGYASVNYGMLGLEMVEV